MPNRLTPGMGKFESLTKTSGEDKKYLETLKNSVDEIKQDRTDLKEKIKEIENKKSTDGATAEQLKELLKQNEDKLAESEKARNTDRLRGKLAQKALEKGFVKNKHGEINSKLLESAIDVGKLTEDDDGNIIGIDRMLEDLRKDEGYMFSSKTAVTPDLKGGPKSKLGSDIGDEAFKNADTAGKVAIMKARGVAHKKANNGLMPGMGNAKGLGPEPKQEKAESTESAES